MGVDVAFIYPPPPRLGLAKRLRETVNQLDTNNMQNKVLERTAKNLSVKVWWMITSFNDALVN